MTDVSKLSDADLMAAIKGPPSKSPDKMSDAELMAAIGGPGKRLVEYIAGGVRPVAAPPGGSIDDVGRGLANAATFGLADRAAAGMGALTGIGGERGDYAGNLAREQAKTEGFKKEQPAGSLGLDLVGGAAVPLGAAKAAGKGVGLGVKSLYGALAGTGIGGLQGAAGSKDWTDLPQVGKDAGKGALVGSLVGGSIPAAGKVIGKGYNSLADLVNGNASTMSRGASKHLADALLADSPAAVKGQMTRLGPDAMLADAGPAFLGKAQGASLNSDEGRSVLGNALTRRNDGTNARITGDVNRALGPAEDPQTVTNNIRAHRAQTDDVNYGRALAPGAPQVDTGTVLANLGPMIGNSVGMENRALTNLREMMMTQRPFPVMDPATGRQMIANGQPVTEMRRVPQDDPAILHKIKGELDNIIEYDQPGLGVPAAALSNQQGALKQMRGQLNATIEQQVPGYREANRSSAGLARRADAVNEGTQYLGSGKTTPSPDRFAADFLPREPGEQIAFAKGSRGNIDRVLGTKANDLQALRGELQGEGGWNTAKIATVHGQDAADELIGSVDRNLKFRDTYNKVVENSQTAQRNAAAKAMKPDPSSETPFINPNSTMTGMIGTAGKKAFALALNAMRSDPTKQYGEVASVLSAQGPQRDAHLNALIDALTRKDANAATSVKVGDRSALAAALLANGYLRAPGNRTEMNQ